MNKMCSAKPFFFKLLIGVCSLMLMHSSFARRDSQHRATSSFPLGATYFVENQWPTGYQVIVTLHNSTSTPTTSWQSTFTLPTGQQITSLWNGTLVANGNQITVNNPMWVGGGTIPAGASTTFGIIVSKAVNGTVGLNNVAAVANGNVTPPPIQLQAPVVQAISNPNHNNQFQVSWNTVANAQGYRLQQSQDPNFTQSTVVFTGNSTSTNVMVGTAGTYYYRVVAFAGNVVSSTSNVTSTIVNQQPPLQLQAPVLQAINNSTHGDQFQVQWNAVANAQGYMLQQSQDPNFTQSAIVFNGNNTMANVVVSASGTYYYRVIAFAGNVFSAPSNVVNTVVNQQTPPNSTFIIDSYWESWNSQDSIDAIVNMKVDVINISFANFTTIGTHQYQIAGVEADQAHIQQLVNAAHALNKKVKIAVGGATYPLQYQLQTDADAVGMAQAIATYVTNNNLDGVDFDIEDYPTPALQISLLKNTRLLLPNKLISYTPKSPASTTYPYDEVITGGYQYIDYLSIMAYDYAPGYRYQDDVQALIAMGVPASKIVVGLMPGMDDVGVMTSLADITTAAQFIKANNLKGIMFWDLNRDLDNVTGLGASQATNTAWNVFNSRFLRLFAR